MSTRGEDLCFTQTLVACESCSSWISSSSTSSSSSSSSSSSPSSVLSPYDYFPQLLVVWNLRIYIYYLTICYLYMPILLSPSQQKDIKKNRTLSVPSIQKLTLHFYPPSSDPLRKGKVCLDGVRFLLCDGMPLKTSSAVKRKEAKESNDATWTKSLWWRWFLSSLSPSGCVSSSSFFTRFCWLRWNQRWAVWCKNLVVLDVVDVVPRNGMEGCVCEYCIYICIQGGWSPYMLQCRIKGIALNGSVVCLPRFPQNEGLWP